MSSNIPGDLHVANDVLADMVGNAALECYGVVGMTAADTDGAMAKILPAHRLRRGVVVESTEAGVHVDLYVVIEYGTNILTVSQNLIDLVSFALTLSAHVPLAGVVVHVKDIMVRRLARLYIRKPHGNHLHSPGDAGRHRRGEPGAFQPQGRDQPP